MQASFQCAAECLFGDAKLSCEPPVNQPCSASTEPMSWAARQAARRGTAVAARCWWAGPTIQCYIALRCVVSLSGACVGSSGINEAFHCCRCIETLPQPRTADEASSPLHGARPVIAIAPGNLLEPKSSSADEMSQGQSATGVNVLPLLHFGGGLLHSVAQHGTVCSCCWCPMAGKCLPMLGACSKMRDPSRDICCKQPACAGQCHAVSTDLLV